LVVDPGAGAGAEERAVPEGGGGELVAGEDGRGFVGGLRRVKEAAAAGDGGGVEKVEVAGEVEGA